MVVRQQFGHRPSGCIGNLGIVRVVVLVSATWTFQFWSSFEWSFDNNLGIVRAVVSAIIRPSSKWLFRQQIGHRSSGCFGSQLGHCSSGCFGRNLDIVRQKITSVKVLNDRIQ